MRAASKAAQGREGPEYAACTAARPETSDGGAAASRAPQTEASREWTACCSMGEPPVTSNYSIIQRPRARRSGAASLQPHSTGSPPASPSKSATTIAGATAACCSRHSQPARLPSPSLLNCRRCCPSFCMLDGFRLWAAAPPHLSPFACARPAALPDAALCHPTPDR